MKKKSVSLDTMKTAMRNQYSTIPGVEGFGIGDGTLRIYVQNAEVSCQLPTEFQGISVEIVVTGRITASSSVNGW